MDEDEFLEMIGTDYIEETIGLGNEIVHLVAERDALRAENERLQTTSRCAWCGAVIAGVSPEHRGELALEHLLVCTSHPLRKLEARIADLTAENERLRTALAWYADEDNWHRFGPRSVPVVGDYGDRARAALAGEEE